MPAELRALEVFTHVVDAGSFTRAARQLGVTKSAISKQLASLESELGVQLLVRTTRKLGLTDAGERVYEAALRVAREVEALREHVGEEVTQVSGHLRIAAPSALGNLYLAPLIAEFLSLHPLLSAEVFISDALVDLIDQRIDVALRIGKLRDSTLIARKLGPIEIVLCASPAYLRRVGVPKAPKQLALLEPISHGGVGPVRVPLSRRGRPHHVTARGRLSISDGPGAIAAAKAGYGFIVVPELEVAEEVRRGELVLLLPGYEIEPLTLHAVYPPHTHLPARVRRLVEFIEQRWRKPPWKL